MSHPDLDADAPGSAPRRWTPPTPRPVHGSNPTCRRLHVRTPPDRRALLKQRVRGRGPPGRRPGAGPAGRRWSPAASATHCAPNTTSSPRRSSSCGPSTPRSAGPRRRSTRSARALPRPPRRARDQRRAHEGRTRGVPAPARSAGPGDRARGRLAGVPAAVRRAPGTGQRPRPPGPGVDRAGSRNATRGDREPDRRRADRPVRRDRRLRLRRVRAPVPRRLRDGARDARRPLRADCSPTTSRCSTSGAVGANSSRCCSRAASTPQGSIPTRAWSAEAQGHGRAVHLGDGLDYLRVLAPHSLGAVISVHVAEHLPLPVLVELLELAASRLAARRAVHRRDAEPDVADRARQLLHPRPDPRVAAASVAA